MRLETLEALHAFVMAVKHSPAIESEIDVSLEGDVLCDLLEDEIQLKKKLYSIAGDDDLPEILKRQAD